MIWLNVYVVGFIVTFLFGSIIAIIDCKHDPFHEPSFWKSVGESALWPLWWVFIILMYIFG